MSMKDVSKSDSKVPSKVSITLLVWIMLLIAVVQELFRKVDEENSTDGLDEARIVFIASGCCVIFIDHIGESYLKWLGSQERERLGQGHDEKEIEQGADLEPAFQFDFHMFAFALLGLVSVGYFSLLLQHYGVSTWWIETTIMTLFIGLSLWKACMLVEVMHQPVQWCEPEEIDIEELK